MENNLPNGWEIKKLVQHIPVIKTGVREYRGEKFYFSTGSVSKGQILPEGKFSFKNRPARANRLAIKGDVLQARMQESKKALLIDEKLDGSLFSTGFLQFRPSENNYDSRLFHHYLCSDLFLKQRDEFASGSTQVALTDDGAENIDLVIPPQEQHAIIADKLDILLIKLKDCQDRFDKIPVIFKRFRESIILDAFSGELTREWRIKADFLKKGECSQAEEGYHLLPNSWKWGSLNDVCEKIVDCPHSTPTWTASGRICVRTTNFRKNFLSLSEVRYVSEETYLNRIERLCPQAGDILYSREGGILGIACMIPDGVDLCLGQRMMLFRVKKDYSNRLLMYWLNGAVINHRVSDLIGGSAAPHLNVKDIKSFLVPLPTREEQNEILKRLDGYFYIIDKIEIKYRHIKNYTEKLEQSILAKAFRGELVSQSDYVNMQS